MIQIFTRKNSSMYFSDEFMNLNRNTNMEKNIAVKEMPAMELIYGRHVGRFDQIGGAFAKLMKWAGPRGLLKFPDTLLLPNQDTLGCFISQMGLLASFTS
jgi:hypothetical protein